MPLLPGTGLLSGVSVALEEAERCLRQGLDYALAMEDLNSAKHAMNDIRGKHTSEDLLDHIFSNFCIGK